MLSIFRLEKNLRVIDCSFSLRDNFNLVVLLQISNVHLVIGRTQELHRINELFVLKDDRTIYTRPAKLFSSSDAKSTYSLKLSVSSITTSKYSQKFFPVITGSILIPLFATSEPKLINSHLQVFKVSLVNDKYLTILSKSSILLQR